MFKRPPFRPHSLVAALLVIGLVAFQPLDLPAAPGVKVSATPKAIIRTDEEAGPLSFPFITFVDPVRSELYLVDGKGRVIIYSDTLFPLATARKGNGVFSPASVAVDEAGNVYVAQGGDSAHPAPRISMLDACLKLRREITFRGFDGAEKFSPHKIALGEGRLFCVGTGVDGIVVLDREGAFQRIVNPAGGEGPPPRFSGLTVDSQGVLYALSEELGKVFVLDRELKTVRTMGQKGGSSGSLSRPQGVAVDDRRGLVYVVDYMRHSVSVYDLAGQFLDEIGGMGISPGWFQYPKDCAVDPQGRLYVADAFNQRVQVLEVSVTRPPAPRATEGESAPEPESPAPEPTDEAAPPAETTAPPQTAPTTPAPEQPAPVQPTPPSGAEPQAEPSAPGELAK